MRFRADFVAVATKIGYIIAYISRIVNPVKQILNNYLSAVRGGVAKGIAAAFYDATYQGFATLL